MLFYSPHMESVLKLIQRTDTHRRTDHVGNSFREM